MKIIRIDETTIGHAIQDYLEDRGYVITKLELAYDPRTKKYYALAQVDND